MLHQQSSAIAEQAASAMVDLAKLHSETFNAPMAATRLPAVASPSRTAHRLTRRADGARKHVRPMAPRDRAPNTIRPVAEPGRASKGRPAS
jgi:hypothetical protein